MPLTTPFFPLTASQQPLSSSPSTSSSSSSSSSPSAPHPVDSPHGNSSTTNTNTTTTTTTTTTTNSSSTHDAPLSSPFAPPPYAVPSGLLPLAFPPITANPKSSSTSRPPSHGRRYTLSRLPLLRKGSREPLLSRSPSALSIRNTASNHESTDPPFVATGAPRASSSISRGRNTISEQSDSEDDKDNCTRTQSRASRAGNPDKMHQTSSRLLRMTDDERPFTRDFKDLYSTLMVSLPLTPHRVRFRMIDFTFTSDEAITNLGSLKFSQSNRMPDPKDSSRVVTTTTTTTFSMAKEMARSVCQKFLEAKFIESVEGKLDFTNKSSVWQLTPKGIHILERFCTRNGIQSAHVKAVIESNRNPRQLVILERNTENDKLHHDEQTVEIIFRRFIGTTANETASDSDSIHEFSKCDVGVKLVKHRPTTSRQYEYTFHGRNAAQWLLDCSTMVDPREAIEVGSLFLQLKLIAPVDPRNSEHTFQPSKQVHYFITPHGERVAGWSLEETPSASDATAKSRDGIARDSNSNRTNVIIRNPSWRLLYREFLKETMCEENLSFYLEVQEFNSQYRSAINVKGENKVETIRETLAAAYGLYNAFLAPGSPNELNIDHGLRTQLATRMTRAVGDDAAMLQSLNEVASLFEKAQTSIFKLMSSDSVPKFIKHPKYAPQLRGLDAAAASAYTSSSPSALRS